MEQCLTIFIVFFKISLKVLNQMFERKKKTDFCLQCLYIWKLRFHFFLHLVDFIPDQRTTMIRVQISGFDIFAIEVFGRPISLSWDAQISIKNKYNKWLYIGTSS